MKLNDICDKVAAFVLKDGTFVKRMRESKLSGLAIGKVYKVIGASSNSAHLFVSDGTDPEYWAVCPRFFRKA